MATNPKASTEVGDPEWLEFESMLGELARIAKSGISFERLVRTLLEHTVHLLAAEGGAVWLSLPAAPLRLECQVSWDAIGKAAGTRSHQSLLELARADGETLVVPPGITRIGSEEFSNPTDFTLLIAPLKLDHDVVGLFEIVQRSSVSAAAVRGNRRLLGLVCELAADHLRRRELRQLQDEKLLTEKFDDFVARIHGSLDLRTVAYELVNAGRGFIDCDRVGVAIRKGRGFRLVAISSADSIDRRANALRRLEELAACVARANEIVWYDGKDDDAFEPQILDSLRRYSDIAHPRMVGLLPLSVPQSNEKPHPQRAAGVLIVEQFRSVLDHTAQARAARIAGPSTLAIVNALRYRSLPTLPFARNRKGPDGQPAVRISLLVALLAAVGLMMSLFFVPMDFNVYAEGELQPEKRRHIFAPFDAQVASISVQHGDQVAENDILLELRSPDLDLESQRIQGELATTQERISAVESSLLQASSKDDVDERQFSQLAAEQEELRQQSASLQQQLSLLREEREKLVVRSPIAGQVLTWNLDQLLADRPVQRGQSLLSVADLQGPWVAELKVPDDKIGHVFEASDRSEGLSASFQLATNRGIDYHGVIRRISTRADMGDDSRAIVRVTMDVDEATLAEKRPGATVYSEIHCGKRSAAYVLFHDLYEAVHNWLRF
jgi:multidrug efflux pump subunit AcrA (membrane-fusion protein)